MFGVPGEEGGQDGGEGKGAVEGVGKLPLGLCHGAVNEGVPGEVGVNLSLQAELANTRLPAARRLNWRPLEEGEEVVEAIETVVGVTSRNLWGWGQTF